MWVLNPTLSLISTMVELVTQTLQILISSSANGDDSIIP